MNSLKLSIDALCNGEQSIVFQIVNYINNLDMENSCMNIKKLQSSCKFLKFSINSMSYEGQVIEWE